MNFQFKTIVRPYLLIRFSALFSADLKLINFQLKINIIMKTEFELNENEALNKTDVSGSVILPKDLRIGNIIKTPRGIKTINSLGFKDTVNSSRDYFGTFDKLHEGYFLDYCKGIDISEDLLLKLNAVKLDFKDFPSFNLFGMQINFIDGLWVEYVSRVEIKGLHHLQNIFFFRNSEELQIQLIIVIVVENQI